MSAYGSTDVSVEKSQGEIRKILVKYGAVQFTFAEGEDPTGRKWAGVEFLHDGHRVRLQVPLKEPEERWLNNKIQRARTKTRQDFLDEHYDQEARRIWRVVYWSLKARMVAIEENVETFEQAFLAHLVDPVTNQTLWDHVKGHVESGTFKIGGGGLRELTATTGDIVDAEIV